ncbi:MAG: sigma-70 family RNA polymerase sigma factor [Rikenellaceae bacterium]
MKKNANRSSEQLSGVLLKEYLEGKSGAIEQIIELHRPAVFNYVQSKVRNGAVADDITQDTFIKVIDSIKRGKYSEDGKFLSWVLRISHNMVIDYYRAGKRRKEVGAEDRTMEILFSRGGEYATNAERDIILEETGSQLKQLVDTLPEEQREVVMMRHFMNLSFKEIADQTGVSINTALGRMRYALINLRKGVDVMGLELV